MEQHWWNPLYSPLTKRKSCRQQHRTWKYVFFLIQITVLLSDLTLALLHSLCCCSPVNLSLSQSLSTSFSSSRLSPVPMLLINLCCHHFLTPSLPSSAASFRVSLLSSHRRRRFPLLSDWSAIHSPSEALIHINIMIHPKCSLSAFSFLISSLFLSHVRE